jgi:SAM-dependent methyltransferase
MSVTVFRQAYGRLTNACGDLKTRAEFYRAKRALLASEDMTASEKQLLMQISLQVHHQDAMHVPGYAREYLFAGLSASRCIQAALKSIGKEHAVGSILDFPCGYGRVLRFLKAMYPDSDITGGEIQTGALDFCQRTFGVTPILSNTHFSSLSLPRKFDLIWCGSLITHIAETAAADLLGFFYRHLRDEGVCIFTTHGQLAVDWIEKKIKTYSLSEESQQQILHTFHETGYGYADYVNQIGCGISAVSRSRVVELARGSGSWQEVLFLDHGWDGLQDVYAFAMRPPNK